MAITGTMSAGDQVHFNDVDIAIDQTPSASSFLQVESWGTAIAVSGGDVPVSPFNTFDVTLIYVGNQNPYTIDVECAYTEAAVTDVFKDVADDYLASPGLAYDVQWHPEGAVSGNYLFTTTGGKLTNVTLPQGTSTGSDPILFTMTIVASSIAISVVI